METNVQTDKKGKKGKKFEAQAETAETQAAGAEGAAAAEAGEAIEKAKGAPRPRKWDYGIVNEATIKRAAENPRVAKDIEVAWGHTEGDPTVEAYFTAYGDDKRQDARHGLRVMARRGLIKIVHADGNEFPRDYVAPEPKPKEEKAAEETAQA
jgi:hypothetical protein